MYNVGVEIWLSKRSCENRAGHFHGRGWWGDSPRRCTTFDMWVNCAFLHDEFVKNLWIHFFLANGSEPNGHRALQRSQSLQPSTIIAVAAPSPQPLEQHSQYHQLQQQKFYLNNYTNHHKPNSALPPKISRINSSPASATITSDQQKPQPAPLSFPIQISYNIDGSSTSTASIESPAVKIDYSKFTLPATSPSIKIDLSSFNQQATKPSTSSSGLIDEDYDDYWDIFS